MINKKFDFTVNWQSLHLKPGNVIEVTTWKTPRSWKNESSQYYLIGYRKDFDGNKKYLVSDIFTGELIEEAPSIELLGIRFRGHFIAEQNVNITDFWESDTEFGYELQFDNDIV